MAKMEFSDTKLMFSAHLEKAGSTIKPYAREAYLSWPIRSLWNGTQRDLLLSRKLIRTLYRLSLKERLLKLFRTSTHTLFLFSNCPILLWTLLCGLSLFSSCSPRSSAPPAPQLSTDLGDTQSRRPDQARQEKIIIIRYSAASLGRSCLRQRGTNDCICSLNQIAQN